MAEKLHVVVRADLPPGDQAVQAMHSMRQFAKEHPDRERRWFEQSNHLAFLEVSDEAGLRRLSAEARLRGFRFAEFREPDLGDSLTSVTVAPEGKPVCRRLRKALDLVVLSSHVSRERKNAPPQLEPELELAPELQDGVQELVEGGV